MSKVNTLYSYFQKTPTSEKRLNSHGGSCKVDDNANVQSDVCRTTASKPFKRQRSPVKSANKLTGSSDQPEHIGKKCTSLTPISIA